ncbi:MAG: hypothetical protein ACOX4D_01905 [Bacteroidales bacterium]
MAEKLISAINVTSANTNNNAELKNKNLTIVKGNPILAKDLAVKKTMMLKKIVINNFWIFKLTPSKRLKYRNDK